MELLIKYFFIKGIHMHTSPKTIAEVTPSPLFPRRLSPAGRRRVFNMQRILHELINNGEISAERIRSLLNCSVSGTKKYISELVGAGLIHELPGKKLRSQQSRYCLDNDRSTIDTILQWHPRDPMLEVKIRAIKLNLNDFILTEKSCVKVFRDPLVTALFGPPDLKQARAIQTV
jgi:predicted transcriptional regulator